MLPIIILKICFGEHLKLVDLEKKNVIISFKQRKGTRLLQEGQISEREVKTTLRTTYCCPQSHYQG